MPILPLSRLTPSTLEWLWPQQLPLGNLVLFDGDPGVGKSILTLDLCARITTGREFPDGAAAAAPANVLILNAEDSARELIHPRLQAARADLERVNVWHREPGEPGLRLPGDLNQLDAALGRIRPRLVVIDPLTAFLGAGANLASEHEARHLLGPLADLAAKHGCAVLLIRHLNKAQSQQTLYRGLHSIGFIAACRLAWLAGRDPRLPDRFVLAQQKSNLNRPQPSLGYAIAGHSSGHAVVAWHGPAPAAPDELLAAPSRRDRLRARACQFLLAHLQEGPQPARAITRAAQEHGISKRTLRRARDELKIQSEIVGDFHAHATWWLLPGQELPDEVMSPEERAKRKEGREWFKELMEKVKNDSEGVR